MQLLLKKYLVSEEDFTHSYFQSLFLIFIFFQIKRCNYWLPLARQVVILPPACKLTSHEIYDAGEGFYSCIYSQYSLLILFHAQGSKSLFVCFLQCKWLTPCRWLVNHYSYGQLWMRISPLYSFCFIYFFVQLKGCITQLSLARGFPKCRSLANYFSWKEVANFALIFYSFFLNFIRKSEKT